MGVILTGYVLPVTRATATAVVAAAALVAGCGGSDHGAATTATAPKLAPRPDPFGARKTVGAFLYAPRQPSRVCPKFWVETPKSQSLCAAVVRRLKVGLARHEFALPKRGKMHYELGGVSGKTVTISVGDRQPTPFKRPLEFFGAFVLEREGGGWKIIRYLL
jgi:hypothetical protein